MSVIKLGDVVAERVRALPHEAPIRVGEPAPNPEILALKNELTRLSEALTKANLEIDETRAEVEHARQEGEAKGRESALKAAKEERDQRDELLELGIQQALSQLAEDTKSLETLAALLAREALAKILDDPAQYPDLVARIIRRQVAMIDEQSILKVQVSSADFAEDLGALQTVVGHLGLDIIAVGELKPGECKFQLQLGEIDVGVKQQWAALSGALSEIAASEAST